MSVERPRRLRVMDTYRNLFYAPVYAAVAGGFFYGEGLDVMFGTVPQGASAVEMLRQGEVDIVQTGISRSMMALDAGQEDAPLHVAEINRRDGFFLVSRKPTDGWQWSDLEDATVIPVGFTPVPMTSLMAALRKHGVDAGRVHMLGGLSAEEALERFCAGDADYVHMPNPQAQQLIHDRVGFLAAAVGSELGYLCYSSFAAMPAFIEANSKAVQRFVSGFHKAQRWVAASDAGAIAEQVVPFLSGVSTAVLESSIIQYKALGTWAVDPHIGVAGYEAMRRTLMDGGLVRGRYAYERVVMPEFALRSADDIGAGGA